MKKVENIRLKLNDIRSDIKKFNHDIFIQTHMVNKKTEPNVNRDVPLNNKMKDISDAHLSINSKDYMNLKSINIEKNPTFLCKGYIYSSFYKY
jgi:hypothetical protein